jgi:predicted kinase
VIFSLVPKPPDFKVNWNALYDEFQWLRNMQDCPQDAIHHAEGDVWIHTRMVCEAMIANTGWQSRDETEQAVLFIAALMHDVAKPYCTRTEDDGRITSRGHSLQGEKLAREILWRMNLPFHLREQITALIRYHQTPFFLIEREDAQRNAFRVSQTARCNDLAMVTKADALGRVCQDQQRLLDNIALFVEFCREQNCLDSPRAFPSDHSRFLYFQKEDRDPDYLAFDDTRCEVILMSGLPGAGKDYWIQTNLPDWPVISLDNIRREMKISPTGNQGHVIVRAREMAREFLRKSQNFVWNATNLSRQIREQSIGLVASYNARIRIVYLEQSAAKLYQQNRERDWPVPEDVIDKMLERWEVPDITEAHQVDWIINNTGCK